MNFMEAMQHVISGGKALRAKWRHHEEFFRMYVSGNNTSINITQADVDDLKNKLILSFLNDKSEQVQQIMMTVVREYSTNSFLYAFSEQDANAQDWEILT